MPNHCRITLLSLPPQPSDDSNDTHEARRRWTDLLFPRTKQTIHQLLPSMLPKHELDFDIDGIRGHEQVASFICALTAFCVAANQCVAVGDANSGYIVLPPLRLWGDSINRESRWAEDELRKNAYRIPNAIIFSNNRMWTPWPYLETGIPLVIVHLTKM